jgi:hypothetical protein
MIMRWFPGTWFQDIQEASIHHKNDYLVQNWESSIQLLCGRIRLEIASTQLLPTFIAKLGSVADVLFCYDSRAGHLQPTKVLSRLRSFMLRNGSGPSSQDGIGAKEAGRVGSGMRGRRGCAGLGLTAGKRRLCMKSSLEARPSGGGRRVRFGPRPPLCDTSVASSVLYRMVHCLRRTSMAKP